MISTRIQVTVSCGGVHCHSPSGVSNRAALPADHSCVVAGNSVAAMRRVSMLNKAYNTALISDNTTAG